MSATVSVKRSSKAESRIDARLPFETKRMIERAAAVVGVSTTDFFVSKAYEAAQAILREQERWILNRAEAGRFVAALLDPPAPNAALRKAAAHYRERTAT